MTKKDYVKLAEIVAGITCHHTRRAVALRLADMLEEDNPHSGRHRFMAACYATTPDEDAAEAKERQAVQRVAMIRSGWRKV